MAEDENDPQRLEVTALAREPVLFPSAVVSFLSVLELSPKVGKLAPSSREGDS